MANRKNIKLLRRSVKAWNSFRKTGHATPDLWHADLANLNLTRANLSGAELTNANLTDCTLVRADLILATCRYTNFRNAKLSGSNLVGTTFLNAQCEGVRVNGAIFGATVIADVDLSEVDGLKQATHVDASFIDFSTLDKTAANLTTNSARRQEVEFFLRNAGLGDEPLEYFRNHVGKAVKFRSCFISYSHTDRAFAEALVDELKSEGIQCWMDSHQLRVGDRILEGLFKGIRSRDRVLLCCSKASLKSTWVEDEINMAFEKERRRGGSANTNSAQS
jgi:hypothetical protein